MLYKCAKCNYELQENNFYIENPFKNKREIDVRCSYYYICHNCSTEGDHNNILLKKAYNLSKNKKNIMSKIRVGCIYTYPPIDLYTVRVKDPVTNIIYILTHKEEQYHKKSCFKWFR